MTTRRLLKDQLCEAWRLTLTTEYPSQLINSKRGLQHFFCQHLQKLFDDKALHRRLFIEPCLTAENGKVRIPDLLICHTRSIIGIVEFKYKPRGRASAAKDLSTLGWFLSHPGHLKLANGRYRGQGEDALKKYTLASDALLCWAGVYAKSDADEDVLSSGVNSRGRFLGLHAATSKGEPPELGFR